MRVESHEGWDDNFEADTGTGQVDISLSFSFNNNSLFVVIAENK